MVEIRVEGVKKSFGKVPVLEGVSFTVKDGEFAVLLGPSGCGKTTLLRCVAGLEKIEGGNIYLGGELANDLLPMERDLAMVFQGFSLFPIMSVRENIAFPLKVRGVSKQACDERVREVAKILSIESLLDKTPKEISGGEAQRVAIGRAIARQPKAFLMDEPLSNLDAPLRAQLRSELKRLQKDIGVTALYVTHDQAEALALADNIGVLNRGALLQFGPPQSVFQAPSTAFVARFVGDPQTNILNVSLGKGGAGYMMQGEGFSSSVPNSLGDAVKNKVQDGGVQVSIRPEDMEVSSSKSSGDVTQGTISLDEPLTLYRVVSVKLWNGGAGPSATIKVLVSKEMGVAVGQQVWVKFNPTKFHFFERETGNLIA